MSLQSNFTNSLTSPTSSQFWDGIDHHSNSTAPSEKSVQSIIAAPITPSSVLSDSCIKIETTIVHWGNVPYLLVRQFTAEQAPIENDEVYNLVTAQLAYKGLTVNGIPHGLGEMHHVNSSIYKGEFQDGKPHGRGVIKNANGDKYKGEFQKGRVHGRGVQVNSDGDKYEGEFHAGKLYGQGSYEWSSGAKYHGDFLDGNPHGRGVLIDKNGGKYEGEFRENKPHGRGMHVWPNGVKYIGEFQNGKPHGRGIQTEPNGGKYEGEFQNGKRHGQGKVTNINGSIFEGSFINDAIDVGHFTTFKGTKLYGGGRSNEHSGKSKVWVKFRQEKIILLTAANSAQLLARVYKEERDFLCAKWTLAKERNCPIEDISNEEVGAYLKGKIIVDKSLMATKNGDDLIAEESRSKKKGRKSGKFSNVEGNSKTSPKSKRSPSTSRKISLSASSCDSIKQADKTPQAPLECSSSTAASSIPLQGFAAVLNEIQTVSILHRPMLRIKRWKEKDPKAIRNFTDKHRDGEFIKRYQDYSDTEISKFRQRHHLPGLECVLSSNQFKDLYTGRTRNGHMLSAEMTYADGKVEGGQIGFGIEGNKIYHCYFESTMNFEGASNTGFGNVRGKELDSDEDDGWVCDRPVFTISDDGILSVKFIGERHTIRIYPIKQP